MLSNVLLSLYRSLSRHLLYAALNVLGLAAGIAVFLVLALVVQYERGFDRWVPDAGHVFRLDTTWTMAGRARQEAADTTFVALDLLRSDFPTIEAGTRMMERTEPVSVDRVIDSEDVTYVDPNFFDVLDLPLLLGDRAHALSSASSVALTQSIAEKYFGTAQAIGRTLTVSYEGAKTLLTVTAVLRDLPQNTTLHIRMLTPFTDHVRQREGAGVALADASAQLAASRASYRAAVGVGPGTLVQPADLPGLPRTLDEALDRAETVNPGLAQAALNVQASTADIATARAAWYPTVGLQGWVGAAIGPVSPFRGHAYDREVTGLVTLTQPLLSGGLIASQVRQARDRNEADRQAEALAGRQAGPGDGDGLEPDESGLAAIAAEQRQVGAAALALKGYQLEYGYGLRTTLDVLIADQDLRAAQVTLAGSRHDTIVAEADLLAATGGLEARRLLPGEPHYDPQAAFEAVRTQGATPWDGAVAAIDRAGGN